MHSDNIIHRSWFNVHINSFPRCWSCLVVFRSRHLWYESKVAKVHHVYTWRFIWYLNLGYEIFKVRGLHFGSISQKTFEALTWSLKYEFHPFLTQPATHTITHSPSTFDKFDDRDQSEAETGTRGQGIIWEGKFIKDYIWEKSFWTSCYFWVTVTFEESQFPKAFYIS